MFNALTPVQLLGGIGQVMRAAAEAPVLDDYQRSQLLGAHSVARLLASELAAAADLFTWTRSALAEALDGDERAACRRAAVDLESVVDGRDIGRLVGGLLRELPPDDVVRARVRLVLRGMADREVRALDTPEA